MSIKSENCSYFEHKLIFRVEFNKLIAENIKLHYNNKELFGNYDFK